MSWKFSPFFRLYQTIVCNVTRMFQSIIGFSLPHITFISLCSGNSDMHHSKSIAGLLLYANFRINVSTEEYLSVRWFPFCKGCFHFVEIRSQVSFVIFNHSFQCRTDESLSVTNCSQFLLRIEKNEFRY